VSHRKRLKTVLSSSIDKERRLRDYLARLDGPVAVAFSGGVDSSCLVHLAKRYCRFDVRAVLMDSCFVASGEKEHALKLANAMGINLDIVRWTPLDNELIRANGSDRCYHCKYHMYSLLLRMMDGRGVIKILDGSHMDDLEERRPGLKAIRELGVCTPFREVGIGKSDIRKLAASLPMGQAERRSRACLAAELGHGIELSKELFGW
jgi:uncharacterized protein